ncbi:LysR family transcriptional regulator [Marinobacterium lutimaris]|uniref:Transcriptional regulator, LysR family n=1 Tax=Marinobacterium lutimaris TaxID=568106 RepID=A0A1H5X8V3_9GAMM|nr:LysR family transcriptional regulator [Marinobacterium lutimaris]SEG07870.1 transcriptional regulator, LysR family [Marinobacterium lutimaris]
MISLDDMAVFAAVVDHAGFTAAARVLEISTPVVSKRVSSLEAQLGARLLNRTTRRLSLTEAGRVFYQHCRRVVNEARAAEASVAHLQDEPRGLLRVTAPVSVGSTELTRALVGFMRSYPEVEVELDLSDRRVDLADEGFDLSIRLTREPPEQLSARLLTNTQRVVCAAPEYWLKHGHPQEPGDLKNHSCIVYFPNNDFNLWYFDDGAEVQSVPVQGSFKANNATAMVEAAQGGLGVVMLSSVLVGPAIAAGLLEPVLESYSSPSAGIYALYLPNRYLPTKARVFIDYLVDWYAREDLSRC